MNDHRTDFDFTAEELFQAFRLVLPDDDARRDAEALHEALAPGMDWATSEELLLLLSVATASGREKVDRIRADWHAELPPEAASAEEQRWDARREETRSTLREQGKRLPDDET